MRGNGKNVSVLESERTVFERWARESVAKLAEVVRVTENRHAARGLESVIEA